MIRKGLRRFLTDRVEKRTRFFLEEGDARRFFRVVRVLLFVRFFRVRLTDLDLELERRLLPPSNSELSEAEVSRLASGLANARSPVLILSILLSSPGHDTDSIDVWPSSETLWFGYWIP